MAIMTPDSPMALSLLDAVASPELASVLAAKRQEIEAKKKIESGIPWWKVQGDRTTFYSGNKPETSNAQFLAENGGPVGDSDYARSRMGYSSPQTAPITPEDEAAYQRVYGPKQEPAPFTGPALGSIDPVFKKPKSEFTSDELLSYNQRIADRDSKNAVFKEGVMNQRAAYDKTLPGITANAQKLQRQAGLSPQQAFQVATAMANQEIKPESLLGGVLLGPEVPKAGIAAKGNVDVANINQQGALGVANANNAANQQINQQNNDARGNFLKQQMQNNIDVILTQQNRDLGEPQQGQKQQQSAIGPQSSNDVWLNYVNALRQNTTRIPESISDTAPPRPVMPFGVSGSTIPQGIPSGNAPRVRGAPLPALPLTPEQQMTIDRARLQNEGISLDNRIKNNQLNPTFMEDNEAAKLNAKMAAELANPATPISESSPQVAYAMSNLYAQGKPLPPKVNSFLRALYDDDAYDDDNSKWRLFGRGGWTTDADANTYAQYLDNHYGVPREVGKKWYMENIAKTNTPQTTTPPSTLADAYGLDNTRMGGVGGMW